MNYIDLIILIFCILAAIKGFSKGLVISLASLAGLVLGILFSLRYAGDLADFLQKISGSQSKFLLIAAYILCFTLIVVFVNLIGKSIEKVVEIAALGIVNRIAGAVFGVLKVLFVFSAILYLLKIADPENHFIKPETSKKSFLYSHLEYVLPSALPFLKQQLDSINEQIDKRESDGLTE
ncbi:MAG: CvpA family protein [Bacteroidales bacterium]|nr:CvpA family protein [Bacteroidales bacterium]